ncbi:CrcB family protein [uncultured Microbacterium sp.]|uniref:fluoride efflux transporter FluC n=1 Tax=uncultured Microbacterium sp. TaxID=191216 RepID=UPI0025CD6369|nr:CrcB family protein [uncultured Microbacterium sp.]
MNAGVFVLVALAGGVGAVARFVLDGVVRSWLRRPTVRGTVLINVSGSLLLGLIAGLAAGSVLSPVAAAIIGTGFLGGYTTFSTASYEAVRLLQQHRWGAGLANAFGVIVVATLAAGLGLWAGIALAAALA